jgi:hypothetical protein
LPLETPNRGVTTRLTVYMDPYGRFFLTESRGAYPVNVEISGDYRVVEDENGRKVLTGRGCAWWDVTDALRIGVVRIVG